MTRKPMNMLHGDVLMNIVESPQNTPKHAPLRNAGVRKPNIG